MNEPTSNLSSPYARDDTLATARGMRIGPAALGLAAFALPLFIWGAINAGFFSQADRYFLIPVAIFYGALVLGAAGAWALRRMDWQFAAVAGTYAAFWLTYGVTLWMQRQGMLDLGADNDYLMGIFFVSWSVAGCYLWLASMPREDFALSGVLLGMAATLVLMTIASYSGVDGVFKAAGWVGLVTAVLAWYTSAADAFNSALDRMILPTRPAPLGAAWHRIEHTGHHAV